MKALDCGVFFLHLVGTAGWLSPGNPASRGQARPVIAKADPGAAAAAADVTILMAFSSDYLVGHLCRAVNADWAALHGFSFACDVKPRQEMLDSITPREACTWYKVSMINRFLQDPTVCKEHGHYLVWLDADAVVLNQSTTVSDLVNAAEGKPLIIGEDLSPCCLLNAGVMIIEVCDWSRNFFHEVWASELAVKYHNRNFHEQSTLIRLLQRTEQDAEVLKAEPFHSYRGGPRRKATEHVCIMPRDSFNTNEGWKGRMANKNDLELHPRIPFVFHSVGLRKLEAVYDMLLSHGISFHHHRVFERLSEGPSGSNVDTDIGQLCGIRDTDDLEHIRYLCLCACACVVPGLAWPNHS